MHALPSFPLMILLVFCALGSSLAMTPQEELDIQRVQARAILDAWQSQDPEPGDRKLHLVYWTPRDRGPAPRYRERLSKIFTHITAFYAREMDRNGFGKRTLRLPLEDDGLCKIHLVTGAAPYSDYAVQSGSKIRQECLPVLTAAGIDAERETVVIFCNMSNWDPAARTMSQNSPYYAGGTHRSGTAWQVDSPLLDLDLLAAKEPLLNDGQYGKISPGRYNTIFIGGIAHEVGHALGLPHNRARPDQAALWGTALMGSGNLTYGEELGGEGKGTFLTFGEALRLASHPVFSGSVKGFNQKPVSKLEDISITLHPDGKAFIFSARVTADPPAYGVVAYMDPAGGSNYDATTRTAVPDAQGRIRTVCDALKPGRAGMLGIVVAHVNGGMTSYASPGAERQFPYYVEEDGTVDLSASRAVQLLEGVVAAVNSGKQEDADRAVAALEKTQPETRVMETARVLAGTLSSPAPVAPAAHPGNICHLSDAGMAAAQVGYGPVVINRLPAPECLFIAGGRLFPRGLYAHAPARHAWDLGGKWHKLTGTAALAAGHDGSVVCIVVADGKAIWRSPKLRGGDAVPFDLEVGGVQNLEFKVTDAMDGNRADWGVWLEPSLTR